MTHGPHRRSRPVPASQPTRGAPAPRLESEGLRVAMAHAMGLHTSIRTSIAFLVEMERQGGLRLPFPGYREMLSSLRLAIGEHDD